MTNEEAIYILNNTAWLGTDKGIEVYPAVKKAVEALEKAEKYRRHDLRKNPEDLPEYFEYVMIYTYRSEIYIASIEKISDYFMWCLKDDDFGYCDIGSTDVVAWREIEPFDEEE